MVGRSGGPSLRLEGTESNRYTQQGRLELQQSELNPISAFTLEHNIDWQLDE